MKIDKTIVIFNLSMDQRDPILSHSIDWVNEFAKHFGRVLVVTTRMELNVNPSKLEVIVIGGGNYKSRSIGVFRLLRVLLLLGEIRKDVVVFHHMATKPLAIIGWGIWIMGIPQALWYSHSKSDKYLKFGSKFASRIFTPTDSSFPINKYGHKVFRVGHGVNFLGWDCSNYEEALSYRLDKQNRDKFKIIVLGRVSRIKRVEILLQELQKFPRLNSDFKVIIIGPIYDTGYWNSLTSFAKSINVTLDYRGVLTGHDLKQELLNANFVYNGMENSVDKSAILSAANGCLLISDNQELIDQIYNFSIKDKYPSIKFGNIFEQLKTLLNASDNEIESLRRSYILGVREKFNLIELVERIIGRLELK